MRFSTTLLAALMLCVALPAMGAKKSTRAKAKTSTTAISEKAEMHFAKVATSNPFEIVPAAGMEILDLGNNNSDEEISEMAGDLIQFARKFIGTRYRRGGKAPGGFDCSGFTSYVFSQFGYTLGASSGDQYNGEGERISKDEVSAGDLLFFTGRNSRSGRVGHVGIAISNDPATGVITFIHAASGGGIRVDKTSAPYYSNRYIGAKRVL